MNFYQTLTLVVLVMWSAGFGNWYSYKSRAKNSFSGEYCLEFMSVTPTALIKPDIPKQCSLSAEVSCRLSQLPIGSIISPNPPFYPNNYDSQEYHRLPEGSVFVLDFFHFDVEDLDIHGNRTDYVRFFHGRRTDNFTENYLYGRLEIPFLVISKNNRLRIRFVTNEENTFTGYRADIRELEGDFCDPENIRSDRHLIKKCENWNDKENTFCEVQCRPNYILEGTSTSTCVNGSLSPVRCVLRSELVLHCEDTRLDECPYTLEEIKEYYFDHQGVGLENLPAEEREELLNFEAGRSSFTCDDLCQIHPNGERFRRPRHCGNLSNSASIDFCVDCRLGVCTAGVIFG